VDSLQDKSSLSAGRFSESRQASSPDRKTILRKGTPPLHGHPATNGHAGTRAVRFAEGGQTAIKSCA